MRQIRLQSEPWHAVQLSSGQYAVSHCTSPGLVSIVDVDGQVVRSYGKTPSSDIGPMKNPRCLAVTKRGDVFVADEGNKRILAINSSLTRAQELPLPAELQLTAPRALYLDESRDRLYVGEFGGSNRVIVLGNVRSMSWD